MRLARLLLVTFLLFMVIGCSQGNSTQPEQQKETSQGEADNSNSGEQISGKQSENPETTDTDKDAEKDSGTENKNESKKTEPEEPVQVKDPASILALVNKKNLLPADYIPADLVKPDVPFYFEEDLPKRYMREEAARALEDLFAATKAEGLNLIAASGYRSYDRQKQLYEGYVKSMGKAAADKVSAFPGASEHQTGLAIDVTSPEMGYGLEEKFGETKEGKWLSENAHQYGFIIRYPKGRTEETGYNYEPWHLRYVGKEAAREIYEKNLVLEEYLQ